MSDRTGWGGLVRRAARVAGRRVAETREAFRTGRQSGQVPDLPEDEQGRTRIVCRRHAEKRAVELDEAGRPACYDAGHTDCEGCVEDVRENRIETW
jgi:hypothetical protein